MALLIILARITWSHDINSSNDQVICHLTSNDPQMTGHLSFSHLRSFKWLVNTAKSRLQEGHERKGRICRFGKGIYFTIGESLKECWHDAPWLRTVDMNENSMANVVSGKSPTLITGWDKKPELNVAPHRSINDIKNDLLTTYIII